MPDIYLQSTLDGVDWAACKRDLRADAFDNGRSAAALRRAFEAAQHVALAKDGGRVVAMARLLSDGVSNAYLLDVWTQSGYRRRGLGTQLVRALCAAVPGQHVGLQADDQHASFYQALGFRAQPQFLSLVVGGWLDNAANG